MQKVGIDNRSGARHRPSNGQAISADGWRVALLDIDEETLNGSVAGLPDSAVNLAICCDVADAAGVTKAFATVAQKFGRLDVLVNNAGIAIFKPILNITYEEWSRVAGGQPHGTVLMHPGGGPIDTLQWRWRHRQHHFRIRTASLNPAHGIRY
jgi:hypothetical protein